MSKKPTLDEVAMHVLQGLCANPGGPFQANAQNGWALVNCTLQQIAMTAYDVAEAFLAHTAPETEAGKLTINMSQEQADTIAAEAKGHYKAMAGEWALIAPDGRYWMGDSPLAAMKRERDERIPASIQLARVLSAAKETEPEPAQQGDKT